MSKKISSMICVIMVLCILFTGCGSGLSGTYTSENGKYSVEFTSGSECTWYQDGSFFNGTYEKTDDGYRLEIEGSGFYSNTIFDAEKDGSDLIITGGTVDGQRFVKE